MYSVLGISWVRNTITIDKLKKKGKWKVPYIIFLDDVEVMQYTGLKDKNGREIYEGDIVRWVIPEDVPESEREKRIIFWSKDLCGFHGKTLDSKYHCFIDGELFEIIGNIYENPELLK